MLLFGGWAQASFAIHIYIFLALAIGLFISMRMRASLPSLCPLSSTNRIDRLVYIRFLQALVDTVPKAPATEEKKSK